jgi:hypothetical protein
MTEQKVNKIVHGKQDQFKFDSVETLFVWVRISDMKIFRKS